MEKSYRVQIPSKGPKETQTPDDFFRLPFVMLSVAKRMSGKTASMSSFLHLMKRLNLLDRVILISPTYENNKHYFEGLPVTDVLEPSENVATEVMDILDQEGKDYDEYHEKMKKYREFQRVVKSKLPLESIHDRYFEVHDKPEHKYGGRKPNIVAFWDDCQNTEAFAPSKQNKVSYLCIKHRHIGQTKEGAIGLNLMFACQNYTSNTGGIPKTIRGNTTILCVFKNKNQKELDLIAEEASGEVNAKEFSRLHQEATKDEFGFLCIDFNRKRCHSSMFRQCWNKFLQ